MADIKRLDVKICGLKTPSAVQAALQGGFVQFMELVTDPTGKAVRDFIVALVSPSDGYFYALIISAACIGRRSRRP